MRSGAVTSMRFFSGWHTSLAVATTPIALRCGVQHFSISSWVRIASSSSSSSTTSTTVFKKSIQSRFFFSPLFLSFVSLLLLLLLPPKRVLPSPILSIRVFLEGTGRVLRCVVVGAMIFLDYQWLFLRVRLFPVTHTRSSLPLTSRPMEGKEGAKGLVNVENEMKEEEEEGEAALQAAWDVVHTRCARRIVALAEANGGLYVKTGQILANMSHVLPLVYCQIMSSLQDKVQPRAFEEMRTVLETDLGGRQAVEEWMEYIDPHPIAAASLSQVHVGRRRVLPEVTKAPPSSSSSSLPPSPWEQQFTKDVVIKIQYIDIAARFTGDLLAINSLLSLVGWAYPGFDFSDVVRKLQDTVECELDFRKEASNSIRVGRELWKRGFQHQVICPTIHPDVQSSRVLVMNYIKGVKITDKEAMTHTLHISPKKAFGLLLEAVGFQVFVNGFFHADPHAGNVLVRPMPPPPSAAVPASTTPTTSSSTSFFSIVCAFSVGCTRMVHYMGSRLCEIFSVVIRKPSTVPPQVVLLDFGLCSELPAKEREELCRIWIASVTHNDEALKKLAQRYVHTTHRGEEDSVSMSSSSSSVLPKSSTTTTEEGDEDYALFASCFLQYPYHLFPKEGQHSGKRLSGVEKTSFNDGAQRRSNKKATEEVKKAIHRQVALQMTAVQQIVGNLPKEFALVLRVFLATRAVNQELGRPINRHRCFLKYALEGERSSRSDPTSFSFSVQGTRNVWRSVSRWGGKYWLYMKFHVSSIQNALGRFLLRLHAGEEVADEILIMG